jgi:hypothetical protein
LAFFRIKTPISNARNNQNKIRANPSGFLKPLGEGSRPKKGFPLEVKEFF